MPTDQERAKEKLAEADRVVKDAATRAGSFLVRLLARTREEAEDIWAEAQSLSNSLK